MLIDFGAHPDCLDNDNKLASHVILNLQCIAARHVPLHLKVPSHLTSLVYLHQPRHMIK